MENKQVSFEQILNSTVHMLREAWKADVCVFFQLDDLNRFRVRSMDGVKIAHSEAGTIDPDAGVFHKCCAENAIFEISTSEQAKPLQEALKISLKPKQKFLLSPVSGETRVIGLLLMGPFPAGTDLMKREAELRSAGALCAVLSAHWRLYEWMDSIVPQLNHSIRTPLTAVQGSIGMVLGGVFGQVGNDVKEMLEMAQKGCERTVRAIEEYINTQTPAKK